MYRNSPFLSVGSIDFEHRERLHFTCGFTYSLTSDFTCLWIALLMPLLIASEMALPTASLLSVILKSGNSCR